MKRFAVSIALVYAIVVLPHGLQPVRAEDDVNRATVTNRKPNIVLFLVDDLGYADLSCQGSDIKTPHIDSIARSGVSCSQAYTTAPVCGPSRAGLLTGRYQQRFGFEDNPGPFRRSPEIQVGLDLRERTIADRLNAVGYATGMVGKWHDGDAAQYQPPARGFDEFYGFNNGAQRYLGVDDSETPMMRGAAPEKHGPGYLTDTFGREAVAFVDRHQNEPFFLFVSFNAPHGPLTASKSYLSKYASIRDEKRRVYAAMVDAVDHNVGRVLDKLRACGLEKDTLVVFMSDHGGVSGRKGTWADNGPLRAGKGTLWEGGIRTPLFLQWKAVLPQGAAYEHPVVALDLLPTFIAAAGGSVDFARKLDGVNLLPHLLGRNNARPHQTLYWRMNEMWAIRQGDWKIFKDRGPTLVRLYNLADDPGEQQNVATDHPDKVAELKAQYDAWAADVERPRFGWWQGIGPRVEPQVHSAPVASRPNIVFLFSDDHALRTIGAYGSGLNETPNIDRIANEGVLFTRSFCTNSICCPSRASILTGKHSHKNGVTRNGSPWNGNQFVFTRALSQSGYKTAVVGKWHLRGWPTDEFDYWKLLSGAGGQGHYYNPEFRWMDGSAEKIEGYSTDIITDQSIRWMAQQHEAGQPFLIMCQFKAPHIHRIPPPRHMDLCDGRTLPEPPTLFDDYQNRSPYAERCWMRLFGMQEHILNIVPPAGHYDMNQRSFHFLGRMTQAQRQAFHRAYDPDNEDFRRLRAEGKLNGRAMDRYKYQRFLKDYLGCVAAIDDNVGRILRWIDRQGLAKNTVVVYSSDQGFFTGEHGWNDKRWMYEESLSMPLLMRWPGKIKAGIKVQAMVQNIDYAPTFLEIAGVAVPDEVQGRSLLPLFAGNTPDYWRKSIYYHYYMDGAYNLPRFEGVRTERHKLINYYFPDQAWELFDLEKDPQELRSVFSEPMYAPIRQELERELARLRRQYDVSPNQGRTGQTQPRK
jgi:N-acetylglucosamine-6-sulfatase